MTYNVTNMGDIEEEEEEEEDTTESRLRVCSSQEPSPSPPASPLSPMPSSVRVIKSESVSWPPLSQASQGSQVSQPPAPAPQPSDQNLESSVSFVSWDRVVMANASEEPSFHHQGESYLMVFNAS